MKPYLYDRFKGQRQPQGFGEKKLINIANISQNICSFRFFLLFLRCNLTDSVMDATFQTVNLEIPSSDMQFLQELAKRMGWIACKVKSNSKMSELDKAILDVKEGNVKNFDTMEDMMNYLEA